MNRKFKVNLTEFLNPQEYPDKVMITHSEYTYGVKLPSKGILNVDSSTNQDKCFDPVNFPNIVLKQVGTTSRHATDHSMVRTLTTFWKASSRASVEL